MNGSNIHRGRMKAALLCGMLGCLCLGAGDWLMLYGDASYAGALSWLTEGAARIAPWRNGLAMALAFPGVVLYGIALFAIADFLIAERHRKRYRCITAFSLTPWLCLHLFYVLILYAFAWMNGNGYEAAALPTAEALFRHLSWIVVVSEIMMLPPYLYWAFLLLRGQSAFPRPMAIANPLVFYGVLKLLAQSVIPEGAFRIGFTNGLMSESMILWFLLMLLWSARNREGARRG